MKKILNNSKITFLSLLLLCFLFTSVNAFLPITSSHSTSEQDEEREDTNAILSNPINPESKVLNEFTERIDINNQLHLSYSNKTDNSSPNSLKGLSMIDCPEDLVLNVDISSCTASGELPLPTNIQGLCGGNEFNAETFEGGVLNVMGSLEDDDLTIFAQDFAPGTHLITYTVNDSCDNVFACEFEVMVPAISPTADLKQNIVVALGSSSSSGNEATATIYPLNIDNGSFNPCSPILLEIRKDIDLCGISGNATYNADGHPDDGVSDPNSADYDPDDGQTVKFCCEDLNTSLYDVNGDGTNDIGFVKVWMRVWGDTNLDSIPGNEGDTYVEACTYVEVVDPLAPAIICPSDITLTCDQDFQNLSLTGSAEGYTLCGATPVEYTDIVINLNACNVGHVRRRWSITGQSDVFCDQIITLEAIEVPVDVSFPQQDFTVMNCPDDIVLEEPIWTAGPCDVLGYTVDTDTFFFEDEACLKLVNHLTVINWCKYEPNNPFWDGEGIWEHTFVIKVLDETVPVLEDCVDKNYEVNDHTDMDIDGETCEAMITLTNVGMDPGGENCPNDWLRWQVFVDLWGDGTENIEYSSFLPMWDTDFNDTNGNGIPDIYLKPTKSEEGVSIQLPDIVGSLSMHKVRWKVTDGCNNVATCDSEFLVSDQTPPIANCQDTITVGVAPVEPSRLWAKNYISGAMDNCTSTENLRFTFSATPPQNDPSYDPDRRSSNYILTPLDISNGFVQLPIYIWDERGNFMWCETVFKIDPSLVLNTEEAYGNDSNVLHQNHPNPFQLSTTVSFTLDRATPVKLTFINATSSKMLEIEVEGKQGLNSYALDRDLLSGQGLYYYTMSTKYYRETKKMILIH